MSYCSTNWPQTPAFELKFSQLDVEDWLQKIINDIRPNDKGQMATSSMAIGQMIMGQMTISKIAIDQMSKVPMTIDQMKMCEMILF